MITQQGSNQRPTTSPNPRVTTDQDIQRAAQDLREAVRNKVNQELIKARAQEAARGGLLQGTPVAPTSPPTPQQFTTQPPPGGFDNTIPPQAVDLAVAFFITIAVIIIGLPLARAFARRMDRRGAATQVPTEISSQLTHLNQAVDAIAVEIERISEGQRFTTRLLSEQRDAGRQTLPSGADR